METQDKILLGLAGFITLATVLAPTTTARILRSFFGIVSPHPCPHGLVAVRGKKKVYCLACSQQMEKLPRGRDLNLKRGNSCS
jgi:hypothetical protein